MLAMPTLSTLRHFGDKLGDNDVTRQVSFYLVQSDKISMSACTKGIYLALNDFLPTSTRYVTTVRPNLVSTFSLDNGVYSAPIETFAVNEYGNFGNFHKSLITHVGANEDKNYYAAWYEHVLGLEKGAARNRRHEIDLYVYDMAAEDERLIVERLHDSVDTRFSDHHCIQYTDRLKDALTSNTSIVDVTVYSGLHFCRCNLFDCISARSTDITTLRCIGETCDDSVQMIADYCVNALRHLSIKTADSSSTIGGIMVDMVGEAVAEVGILQTLEIGNVAGDYEEWSYGLVRMLERCPISSLRINETLFEDTCLEGMAYVLRRLVATDVKLTSCDFGDRRKLVFDALFQNRSIRWLDLSYTMIGNGSISELVGMVRRGTLTRLAIGACRIGRESMMKVLQATTHVNSRLAFISIFDNDLDHPVIFSNMEGTSLETIHVGDLEGGITSNFLYFNAFPFTVDSRDSEECYRGGGGVWPWGTKSHTV